MTFLRKGLMGWALDFYKFYQIQIQHDSCETPDISISVFDRSRDHLSHFSSVRLSPKMLPVKLGGVSIPHICHFFTQPQFEAKKFYTWKCINSRHKLSRDKTVCRILLFVFDQLFRVPIGEFFTWLNLFTQPGVVMFVTNIRCGSHSLAAQSDSVSGFSIDHDFDRRAISQWEDITGARFGPFWAFQLLALISFWWETYNKPYTASQVICCQICHFRSKIDHFWTLLSGGFEKRTVEE